MGCPANLSGLHVHSREAAGRRWCRCGHSQPADTTPVDLQRVRQERQHALDETRSTEG